MICRNAARRVNDFTQCSVLGHKEVTVWLYNVFYKPDEERQEPLRVGEAIYLSPSHLCVERRHLSGSGVFFYHQILPLNPDKCSILQKGKSTIPVIDEIEEETAQFCFVNSAVRWKGIMPVCYAVSKD